MQVHTSTQTLNTVGDGERERMWGAFVIGGSRETKDTGTGKLTTG